MPLLRLFVIRLGIMCGRMKIEPVLRMVRQTKKQLMGLQKPVSLIRKKSLLHLLK